MSVAPLLEARGLVKRYGGLVALDDFSLTIGSGRVIGIVGPNGAGKSTLVGLLGGAIKPSAGRVLFAGRDVTSLCAAERARLGIGRTYQIPRPFLDLTVEENLEVAQCSRRQPRDSLARRRTEILERCELAAVRSRPARQLPLLRRKRLELARALALEPRLLLLDEVGAGLVDVEIAALIALISSIAAGGVSILIVEHILPIVRQCCDEVAVLNFGKKLSEGLPAEVLGSEAVAAVYLGTAHTVIETDFRGAAASAVGPLVGDGGQAVPPKPAQVLCLDRVSAFHGQLPALREVSLHVDAGEVVAVLGANGAGKTSLAALISGVLPVRGGALTIAGESAAHLRPDRIAALGVAHCMEGRRIFADLSVEQNLRIAARAVARAEVRRRLDAVHELFPVLAERGAAPGTALSGGEQQMLAIARALMARPRLVVFDEISLGLAPIVIARLYQALAALKHAGLAMLIVEQDVDRALHLADRAYVLDRGSIALEGSAAAVRADPRLRQLYVGGADEGNPVLSK